MVVGGGGREGGEEEKGKGFVFVFGREYMSPDVTCPLLQTTTLVLPWTKVKRNSFPFTTFC